MAYMCDDSDNLMAIAQQVIQQKQQRLHQQQQQQQHHENIIPSGDVDHLTGLTTRWGSQQVTSMSDRFPFSHPEPVFSDPFLTEDDPMEVLGMPLAGNLDHAAFRLPNFGSTAPTTVATEDFDSEVWMDSLIDESSTEDGSDFLARDSWHGTSGGSQLPVFDDTFGPCSKTLGFPTQASSSDLDRVVFPKSREFVLTPRPASAHVLSASTQSVPFYPSPPPKLKKDEDEDGDAVIVDSKSPPLLVKCLLDCARIVDSKQDLASKIISQIRDLASDRGDPTERVAFYFSEALSQRLSAAGSTALRPDFSEEAETTICYRAFSDACPYSNFIHLTTNQAIIEATESAERILIIDFGITKGVQWAALLQALANRPGGKPSRIRLSGIAAATLGVSSARTLAATGNRLLDFARLLDLDFAFEPILEPVAELTSASFRIEPGEAVAVNFTLQLHTMLDDSGELVDRTLRLVKSLRPRVVTLGEYECRLNRLGFVERFGEALRYFSALFESLEAAMDRDSDERAQAERLLLGPRILGVVGPGEGSTRTVRMETIQKWKAIMEGSGLKLVPLSHYAESQAKLLLWNYDYSPKYSILESPLGFLTLAWEGFPLFTVSSWL